MLLALGFITITMVDPRVDIAICIPVKDEEVALPKLLNSLSNQRDIDGHSVTLCFFLDACEDRSSAVIDAARASMPLLIETERGLGSAGSNAGRARRRAMEMGLAAVGANAAGVLLTTDADTVPAPDWVSSNLAALRHAEIVTGDIRQLPDGFSYHHARVKHYFDRLHTLNTMLDPVPWEAERCHHHAGGASMAFGTATYLELDGFDELPRGEDSALVFKARRQGYRVRRDATVVVHTSTRRHGRVEDGFSGHLAALDSAGSADQLLVVDPRVAAWQYRAHAWARQVYRSNAESDVVTFADAVGVACHDVDAARLVCGSDEAFATSIVPLPDASHPLPLVEAEFHLNELVRGWAAA
jgi:GT2 family glycosyltransferase